MTDLETTERNDLIQTLLWVMQQWALESDEKVRLLGLPENTPSRTLQQYQQGKASFWRFTAPLAAFSPAIPSWLTTG